MLSGSVVEQYLVQSLGKDLLFKLELKRHGNTGQKAIDTALR